MRIHRLEVSAFGPFAGTEHIDFDRLSAHGLFLLNGATGAGKTSVLDAICFALYGSVPGARQEGKRLRSDHADAAAEPRVTCEFSAQGRHFEVSRTPAWNKPSARGKNGFTEQKANTLLRERIDGEWLEKSGRNDEAGAEITALLGMDREQFTRVVMLPQGDFAAFLRSKASDRLVLLQSLFGTQRFEAVEQELGRRAAAARTEVESLNNKLELLLAQAEAETAGLGLELDGAPGRDEAEQLLAWLEAGAGSAAAERRAAVEAKLRALQAQIRPHFLFNTFNALSELIHEDPDAADDLVTDLAHLLRYSLRSSAEGEVPLSAELDAIARYLRIERARFGDRLQVAVDVPSALLEHRVPGLILQPLVENAVQHGIAPRSEGGSIRISARAGSDGLVLVVEDDGPGLPPEVIDGSATGLGTGGHGGGFANVRHRLGLRFGGAARLDAVAVPTGGTRIEMHLPGGSA